MFWIKMFIILIIGIVFFVFMLRLILKGYFTNEAEIMDKNNELLRTSVNADIDKSLNLTNELEHVVTEIQSTESLFAADNQNMSLAHKQSILDKWVSYVECYNGLNEIRKKYIEIKMLNKNKIERRNEYGK